MAANEAQRRAQLAELKAREAHRGSSDPDIIKLAQAVEHLAQSLQFLAVGK